MRQATRLATTERAGQRTQPMSARLLFSHHQEMLGGRRSLAAGLRRYAEPVRLFALGNRPRQPHRPTVATEPLEALGLQPLRQPCAENVDEISSPERFRTGLTASELAAVASTKSHGTNLGPFVPGSSLPARTSGTAPFRAQPMCVRVSLTIDTLSAWLLMIRTGWAAPPCTTRR